MFIYLFNVYKHIYNNFTCAIHAGGYFCVFYTHRCTYKLVFAHFKIPTDSMENYTI